MSPKLTLRPLTLTMSQYTHLHSQLHHCFSWLIFHSLNLRTSSDFVFWVLISTYHPKETYIFSYGGLSNHVTFGSRMFAAQKESFFQASFPENCCTKSVCRFTVGFGVPVEQLPSFYLGSDFNPWNCSKLLTCFLLQWPKKQHFLVEIARQTKQKSLNSHLEYSDIL